MSIEPSTTGFDGLVETTSESEVKRNLSAEAITLIVLGIPAAAVAVIQIYDRFRRKNEPPQ